MILKYDSQGFKQQQDNINNHENAQKLDVSALSAQEEINGTNCVGLLLEQWRDVAYVGDEFSDFGTGVLNPTLGKIARSITLVDQNNADMIGEKPFDKKGKFGGNHKDMGEGTDCWIFGISGKDREIYNMFRQSEEFQSMSNMEIHDYLMETTSYDVAAGNILLDQTQYYSDADFQSHTGLNKMRDNDLDFRKIITDYRMFSDNNIYLNENEGVEAYIDNACLYYKNHQDQFKADYPNHRLFEADGHFSYDAIELFRKKAKDLSFYIDQSYGDSSTIMINKLSYYCNAKGYDMSAKRISTGLQIPELKTIKDELDKKNTVTFQAENIKLYKDNAEEIKINGAEQFTVTGKYGERGVFVSYNGERCSIDFDKQDINAKFSDFYSVKITPKQVNTNNNNITPRDIYTEKLKEPGYKYYHEIGWEYADPIDYLDKVLEKGGSAYKARLNVIFDKYKNDEKGFEQKYNIPMYDNEGKPNQKLLLYKLFLETGDKVTLDMQDPKQRKIYFDYRRNYYLENPDQFRIKYGMDLYNEEGKLLSKTLDKKCKQETLAMKYAYDNEGIRYVPLHFGGLFCGNDTEDDFNRKFAEFAQNHGDNVLIEPIKGVAKKDRLERLFAGKSRPNPKDISDAIRYDGIPTNDDIKRYLDSGYEVVFKTSDAYYLEDANGNQGTITLDDLKADNVTITGITADNKYVVAVNGKNYIYDAQKHPADCSDYFAIKVG